MITYEFTKRADRQLCKLPLSIQRRIVTKIKYTTLRPAIPSEDGKIIVTEVGLRDSVYK